MLNSFKTRPQPGRLKIPITVAKDYARLAQKNNFHRCFLAGEAIWAE